MHYYCIAIIYVASYSMHTYVVSYTPYNNFHELKLSLNKGIRI